MEQPWIQGMLVYTRRMWEEKSIEKQSRGCAYAAAAKMTLDYTMKMSPITFKSNDHLEKLSGEVNQVSNFCHQIGYLNQPRDFFNLTDILVSDFEADLLSKPNVELNRKIFDVSQIRRFLSLAEEIYNKRDPNDKTYINHFNSALEAYFTALTDFGSNSEQHSDNEDNGKQLEDAIEHHPLHGALLRLIESCNIAL